MRPDESRFSLMEAALGKIPCDLTLCHVQLVNVLTGEIYPAEVDVLSGVVVRVREEGCPAPLPSREKVDGGGRYLYPGFLDAHMHVESTMMLPQMAARAILPWGTTTICTDPHEIANVLGLDGVRFMLENSRLTPLRQYVLAPSCVPAVPAFERSGAAFFAKEIGEMLSWQDVVGVAELMDYPGILAGDERMSGILAEGRRHGVLLQGHAPQMSGGALAAYRIAGPESDHESGSAAEIREKLRCGMRVNLRAGSIVDYMDDPMDALRGMTQLDLVSVCTDDVHASDLISRGHVNRAVQRLIASGMDPVQAIRMATLHAAQEYGFKDLGAIAPGYQADFQLNDRLDGSQPYAVYVRGQLVAQEGRYLPDDGSDVCRVQPRNTMHVSQAQSAQDFYMKAPAGRDTVEALVMERVGQGVLREGTWVTLPVKDGFVSLERHPDLAFICVINRHGADGFSIAVTRDFGLREGAIASTVSHDSHNLTIVYRDVESAWQCLTTLAECGGGMCAARNGRVTQVLPLPVAGLMSLHDCRTLAPEIDRMVEAMQALCSKPFSLLDISVYCLPAMPGMVITDQGLVNSTEQRFVEPIR